MRSLTAITSSRTTLSRTAVSSEIVKVSLMHGRDVLDRQVEHDDVHEDVDQVDGA